MEVTFWGVRGSIPAPGPTTNRYGGNTSCVSVRTLSGDLIVLDMGTGVTRLGASLMKREYGKGGGKVSVLLSHAHWDHIQGFGFFPPAFVPGNRIAIYGPARSSSMLEGILEGQMSPHFSPIYTLKNMGAEIQFVAMTPEVPFGLGDVTVSAMANPHGTTVALAYRIEERGRVLVYASDAGYPESGPAPETIEHYREADLLIHDCTYTPADREARRERGFSSYADAAEVAVRAGAKHLVMFHYDQDYSDDVVDNLRAKCRNELDRRGGQAIDLTAASEGLTIEC